MSELEKNIGFLWPCDGLNDSEYWKFLPKDVGWLTARYSANTATEELTDKNLEQYASLDTCLLYTSPSPRDRTRSRMPSSA